MADLWLSPHAAVVLGIDAAETSGWGIVRPCLIAGRRHQADLEARGIARTHSEIDAAVHRAHDLAHELALPLVVAAEDWQWSPRLPPKSYGALREQWGRWRHGLDKVPELELFGGDAPAIVIRALCATWRGGLGLRPFVDAGVLARPKRDQKRAAWKRSAVLAVRGRFGVDVSDDEAEAICVAVWGIHSQQLADLLAPKPKPRRRAS